MNRMINSLVGSDVEVELMGDKRHQGILVDCGPDILVLYNGSNYLYIPFPHIKLVKPISESNIMQMQIARPSTSSPLNDEDQISYRKVLLNAKGIFTEIFVTGNQQIHGYVTNVLTNYFVFYSPVYKAMFIPLIHLKWLIPYNSGTSPYSLDSQYLPVNPSSISLSRTIEEQLTKLEGKIVIFDLGLKGNKIGLLNKSENGFIELITAEQTKLYYNISHIMTIHSPQM